VEGGPARPNNEKEMALTNLTNGLAPKSRPYTWSGRGGTWRRSLASLAFAWPWFDGASEWALRRFFFPTSRLWAAARTADGSAERFYDTLGLAQHPDDERKLAVALARFQKARARAAALEAEWQRVFFGWEESSVAYRSAVEAARLDAAHAYSAARRFFAFLLRRGLPPIKLDIQSPEVVETIYGKARSDLASFTALPGPMPAVEISRPVPGVVGTDCWLRFKSPRLGDAVYARVHEPVGVSDPPTLIFGHGVCVEFDHWRGLIDEATTLCAAGFRVIRPEAPWHGRRTPAGAFAGERLIATFPTGLLDGFFGALQEWAVLADWSRKTSRAPLAFGGTSLGALTAQFAADHARNGPERLKPDGLFLITHCGRLVDATAQGEMTNIFGAAYDPHANGWTPEHIADYLRLLDPRPKAPVAPERIVTVLGKRDRVTPFASGLALVQAWGVPAANQFIFDRGHFSMPMTLIRKKAPVARFCRVMAGPPPSPARR
jgi:pimeloyl-ACP methyl ester carboxylesterase